MYLFAGCGFTHMAPKVILAPNPHAQSMFSSCPNLVSVDWSMVDFSKADNMYGVFSNCPKLTDIDTDITSLGSAATYFGEMFRFCYALERIQKITAYETATWKNTFQYCYALTHVIFDGTIGASGLDLQWSTGLDKESITSIINALSDSTSGLSITLSNTAVNNAFYSEEQDDLRLEWYDLIATKENWTISLV